MPLSWPADCYSKGSSSLCVPYLERDQFNLYLVVSNRLHILVSASTKHPNSQHVQGIKQSVLSLLLLSSTKLARSRDPGNWATRKHNKSIKLGQKKTDFSDYPLIKLMSSLRSSYELSCNVLLLSWGFTGQVTSLHQVITWRDTSMEWSIPSLWTVHVLINVPLKKQLWVLGDALVKCKNNPLRPGGTQNLYIKV